MFAVNATILSPTSVGITAESVTGTASIAEVQVIRLLQNPAAVQNTWTATFGAMTITRLQAGGSGLNEIQRVTIPQGTYAGGFSLAFGAASSASLSYTITDVLLQAALQALSTIGANNATVIQSSTVTWDITFTGTLGGLAQSLLVANSVGLSMPMYLAANINLNVQGIFDYLTNAGTNSASATIQIQQGASVNTVLQALITLNSTLIQGTPSVPVPGNPWQTLTQVNALITAAVGTVATATTLGTVIVPTAGRLLVDGSGNISVPLASASVFGVVKTSTGLTSTAGVITVNAAQAITSLSTLTTNGSVETTGGAGALSVVTNTGTGSNVHGTGPTIAGGTHTALTGLGIRSTGAAFDLTVASAEVFTAGRTLSVVMGDAARTLTLSGNPTINDWFNQSVKTTDTPTFANLNYGNLKTSGNQINEVITNASTSIVVNYSGYAGGTTQFRDFGVYDGKNNALFLITGSTGNVVIGAASATTALTIGGGAVTGQKYFYTQNSSGDNQLGIFPSGIAFLGSNAAQPLTFYTGAAERMRIDATGNVGIGVTPTLGKVHISSSGNPGDVQLALTRTAAGTYGLSVGGSSELNFVSGGYAGTVRMTLDANGNLIMGTAALATSATNGFLYMAGGAGAPTGAPTANTGRYPFYYDSTNNKIWVYNGSWRGVVVT
jgi:hypothetical protein